MVTLIAKYTYFTGYILKLPPSLISLLYLSGFHSVLSFITKNIYKTFAELPKALGKVLTKLRPICLLNIHHISS